MVFSSLQQQSSWYNCPIVLVLDACFVFLSIVPATRFLQNATEEGSNVSSHLETLSGIPKMLLSCPLAA